MASSYRNRLVVELKELQNIPLVRKRYTNGPYVLDENETKQFEVYEVRITLLLERIKLWDACNGRSWWDGPGNTSVPGIYW